MKCSVESHISHIFADIFISRHKAYSKKGLRKLLQLRVLRTNGINIKDLYLKQLINPPIINKVQVIPKISKQEKYLINEYDIEHKLLIKNIRFLYN